MTQVVSSSPAETSPRPTPAEAPNAGTTLLPTTVVGSYSVPEWLERLKTDYYQRRISGAYLQEIHEVAIKAAIKDQERAGVQIVSDGELRRDNDVDYFLARMPGVEIPRRAKNEYYRDEADLVMAFARVLNREARALAAAGVTVLQVDEPFLAGYPE